MSVISSFFWVLLTGGTGGGVVAAVANWLEGRRRTRIDFLQHQLEKLYGPLAYLTSCNKILWKRVDTLQNHLADPEEKCRDNPHADAASNAAYSGPLMEQINSHRQANVENNRRIVARLQNKWHLADTEDLEQFASFQADVLRLNESPPVYCTVLDKLVLFPERTPEFVAYVNNRFRLKKERLERLSGSRMWTKPPAAPQT